MGLSEDQVGELVADLTYVMHWPPREAGAMTLRQLHWWGRQAIRICKLRKGT